MVLVLVGDACDDIVFVAVFIGQRHHDVAILIGFPFAVNAEAAVGDTHLAAGKPDFGVLPCGLHAFNIT